MIKIVDRPNYQFYRIFLWADVLEILSIINYDKSCSKSDFLDRFFPTKKDIENEILEEQEETMLPSEQVRITVATKEGRERFMMEIFAVLEYRSNFYGENHYPFTISNGVLLFNEKHSSASSYCYLLMSSHTGFLTNRSFRSYLQSDFEKLSSEILQQYLGKASTVEIFGAGTHRTKIEGKETTTIADRFKSMAERYNGRYLGHNDDPRLKQTSGDFGLDLIGSFSFPDKLNSHLLIYGQCKCSDEWSSSIFESSDESLNEIIKFKSKPVSAIFIPFCFRSSSGTWAEDSLVRSTVLFDRFRILKLKNFDDSLYQVKSQHFLQTLMNFTESIV